MLLKEMLELVLIFERYWLSSTNIESLILWSNSCLNLKFIFKKNHFFFIFRENLTRSVGISTSKGLTTLEFNKKKVMVVAWYLSDASEKEVENLETKLQEYKDMKDSIN